MLKTCQLKTHCKGDSHNSNTANIILPRHMMKLETKASSHQEQCIPAVCSVNLPRRVLITVYVNNNNAIFFKTLSYLYEVVCTNFSADFWTFRNF